MSCPNSAGSSGDGKPNPSVIDLGTIFVDSDIIFGFTSHLLKRKTKVCQIQRHWKWNTDINTNGGHRREQWSDGCCPWWGSRSVSFPRCQTQTSFILGVDYVRLNTLSKLFSVFQSRFIVSYIFLFIVSPLICAAVIRQEAFKIKINQQIPNKGLFPGYSGNRRW